MAYYQTNNRFTDISVTRLRLITGIFFALTGIVIIRLFFLQVFQHDELSKAGERQHLGGITIPARRGEILTKDTYTGNYFKLATNITLDLLYIDPQETPDKAYVANLLAPLIFTEEDYHNCQQDPELCPNGITVQFEEFNNNEESEDSSEEEQTRELSHEEMIKAVEQRILQKISQDEVEYSTLQRDVKLDVMTKLQAANIPGLILDTENSIVAINPLLVPQNQISSLVGKLQHFFPDIARETLEYKLKRRKVRYVPLKRRLDPSVSEKIKALRTESAKHYSYDSDQKDPLKGVVLLPEHWRFYPNLDLAAQTLGFYNNDFGGQYGLEESFDSELIGQQGKIMADTDPTGNAINIGNREIVRVVNGKSLVLTIDPPIQRKVEEILSRNVKEFKAYSGQVIIMDPFSGAIIAMANYPSFDPNDYSAVYELEKAPKWEKYPEYIPVFVKEEKQYRRATKDEQNNYDLDRYVYQNGIGPEAYRNKIIQDIYEPGSVFKPIAMAIALDLDEVTPNTKYLDTGVVKTGEYMPYSDKEIEIHNANYKTYGWVTTTQCLEQSINTCMAFVAEKLGKRFYAPAFHDYIKDFGFGDYTDIELLSEEKGQVTSHTKWTTTQLMTTAFGQGIAATPLQVVRAWAAMANGGVMIRPHILAGTIDTNGNFEKVETKIVGRAISQETSSTITAMLVSTVTNGVALPGKVPGYLLAGKTGTSQIAKKNGGGYETGEGANITSFAGYAPVHHPKFVMLVKFDRPRYGSNSTWGSTTAAPTFREIAEFLFTYYNIPPDDE